MTSEAPALILRTVSADGTSYCGFKWPLEVGATVEAPDWNPKPQSGNGLHGFLWGEGDGNIESWCPSAVWLVCEVDEWVDLVGKVKFPRCVIRFAGSRIDATSYLIANGAAGKAVIGATMIGGNYSEMTGGNYSTMIGGYGTTMTGGDYSKMIGGDHSEMIGGNCSKMTGGDYSEMTGGNCSKMTGGDYSEMTGGNCSKMTGRDSSKMTGGDHSEMTAGDYSEMTGGNYSEMTAGYGAKMTGGDHSEMIGGYSSTMIGGNYSEMTGGNCSKMTGGYGATLCWHIWDGSRCCLHVANVGKNGIKPGVAYTCGFDGKIREASK